jgi:phage tail-like protein
MKRIQIGIIIISGLLTPQLGVAKKEVVEPLIGFYCALEIQGIVSGYFVECSNIGSESEVIEHKVVNEHGVEVVLNLPGRIKYNAITLKRGITSNQEIWDWRQMVVDGNVSGARQDGSLVMLDQELNEVARWNFENAWPVSITGSTSGVEVMTIVHEGIERAP